MLRYQPLQLVHLSFFHFLCIWHSAHLSLLAILYHFLNQTSNKMEFPRTNILNFVYSPAAVYITKQTFFSISYLLATNDSTTKTLKLIPFGEGIM